jgi:hypothetical protein
MGLCSTSIGSIPALGGHGPDSLREAILASTYLVSSCGREVISKSRRTPRLGVRRIVDLHPPRGYREIRANVEMRKLMDKKIGAQNSECAICGEKFTV